MRKVLGVHRLSALALVLGAAWAGAQGQPVVYWASDPVLPGEVVVAQGGGWGARPYLEVSWLKDGPAGSPAASAAPLFQKTATVWPLDSNPCAVKFLLPKAWKPGIYAFQVVDEQGRKSAPHYLNEPNTWWLQGDWGREASPGGWLRVLGLGLSAEGKAQVLLRGAAKDVTVAPATHDPYSLEVSLPSTLSVGDYQVWVHNGRGGAAGWREAGSLRIQPHPAVWKSDLFDIRDYGAIPDDRFENTAAVQAALDAAGANGGGIVYVPLGRFQIYGTLTLPPHVLLRGESPEKSMLYWRDRMIPLPTLIQGTNNFGVQDLSVYASNHVEGITSDAAAPGAGNIFIKNVHLRMNRYMQIHPSPENHLIFTQRTKGWDWALHLSGENVQVTDCEIYSSCAPFNIGGPHALLRNNKVSAGRFGSWVLGGPYMVCEDNVILGGDNQSWGGANYVGGYLYFARNEVGIGMGGDRELMTTDGGSCGYVGKVTQTEGVKMTLARNMTWGSDRDWFRTHPAIFILEGTGAGQLRELKSFDKNLIEIDRPWDIPPDETSVVRITTRNHHQLILDNTWTEGTIAIQGYVQADHWVVQGNRSARCGGFHWQSLSQQSCWRVQVLDNAITEGSGWCGPENDQPPSDSHFEIRNRVGSYMEGDKQVRVQGDVRCTVMRRNVVENNGYLGVTGGTWDTLIENCTVRNSREGLRTGGSEPGLTLLGNRFENVTRPLVGAGIDKAIMNPAERLLSRLSAQGLVPAALQSHADWKSGLSRLAELSHLEIGDPGLAEATAKVQVELAKAAARALPEGQPLALFQALWGVGLEYASAPLAPIFASASGGRGQLLLISLLPAWSQPLSLTVQPTALVGWEVAPAPPMTLLPGKDASARFDVTVPAGVWGPTTVPVTYEASGEGWRMHGAGTGQLGAWGASGEITQWLVVGPFESDKPGQLGDKVYPPERRLDAHAEYPGIGGKVRWQPLSGSARIDFTKLFGSPDRGVAYAAAVLRAKKPTPVSITYGGVTYLNGQRLGVPFRAGNIAVPYTLQQGDNVLLCAVPRTGADWNLTVSVRVTPAAAPGEVAIVAADQLSRVPALTPPPEPAAPEGAGIPFADGHDWKLVYEDDFDRNRLGTDWQPSAGSNWLLQGGKLVAGGSFEYLTYAGKITPPLRVEADLTGSPKRSRAWMNAFTLTKRNEVEGRALWYDVKGWGYMLMLGWHNRLSNELWRGNEEKQVSDKGPFLTGDKTSHVIAQFAPGRLLLVVDGQVSLDWKDPEWLPDLDTFSFFSGWSRDGIDNVRIYSAQP